MSRSANVNQLNSSMFNPNMSGLSSTIEFSNEQRFIDINIDSETDNEASLPKAKISMFNFGSGKTNSNKLKTNSAKSDLNSTANTSLALMQKTDLLLSNLSEIGINSMYSFHTENFDFEDDDDDEDDYVNKGNDRIDKIYNYNSQLRKLSRQLNNLDSTNQMDMNNNLANISSITPTNADPFDLLNSTPLNSNSFDSIEQIQFDLKGISQNETLLCGNINNDTLSKSKDLDDLNKTISQEDSNNVNYRKYASEKKSPVMRSYSVNHATKPERLNFKNRASLSNSRNDSLVEGLLGDIYDRFNISFKETFDSDVLTEISASSSRLSGVDSNESETFKLARSHLQYLSNLCFQI